MAKVVEESLAVRLARALGPLAGLSFPEDPEEMAALERRALQIRYIDCKPLVKPPHGWVVERSEVLTIPWQKPPRHLFRATVLKPDGSRTICEQELQSLAEVKTKFYWTRLWREVEKEAVR